MLDAQHIVLEGERMCNTSTKIYIRDEAWPIGEVFGLISVWEENEHIYGELFFSKESNQSLCYKIRQKIKIGDAKLINFDMEKDLFFKMDTEHKNKNLYPLISEVSIGDFNPYDVNRFSWYNFSIDSLYNFLDSYKIFFDSIYNLTKNEKLKEKIKLSKQIKSMIIVDEIRDIEK
ncbi:hypothetical protein [Treponema sp. Marseille-Q4132]|uniref:hypothetical protein n=1 Tax=Treponema sp. Marseille-Q4132 TaxID=2766701 RepID=UPI001653397C|nr:hypothetical protein [Treponema sp. Marseille-Q4132]QNL97261.1 hypothetical protein H9I35_00405 [Treponema sp. Marseille-Q4132]